MISLASAKKNIQYRVIEITKNQDLFTLYGITTGSILKIESRGLFGMIFKIKILLKLGETSFMLRGDSAKYIFVEVLK
jgi:Fe2+ transport system protein FeoA